MGCLNCNAELNNLPKKREKIFCNSTCRSNYWQKVKKLENDGLPADAIIKSMSFSKKRTTVSKPMKLDKYKKIIANTPTEIKEKISNQLDALEINERIAQLEKEIKQPPKEFSSSLMKRLYFSIREKELKQLKP